MEDINNKIGKLEQRLQTYTPLVAEKKAIDDSVTMSRQTISHESTRYSKLSMYLWLYMLLYVNSILMFNKPLSVLYECFIHHYNIHL